jgi:thiol:disulfide interchange protein DsbC
MSVTRRFLIPLLLVGLPAAAVRADAELQGLRETLGTLIPPDQIESIERTPVNGLYEVVFGGRLYYFSADGAYLLRGELIEVASRRNLTEDRRRTIRLSALDGLGESTMIVFSPERPKHTITVFTDVDCPYCARFHLEVPKLNEMGVKVRYAAFPRQGIPSTGYDRMVSVWCAKDQRQAMGDAKSQRPVAPAACENPVRRHFELGQALGVGGTPTIILDNGEVVGGYVPYRQLVERLESD